MKNYTLKKDETVLFRADATLVNEGKKVGVNKAEIAEIILTNHAIVVSVNKRNVFKTTVETAVYDVKDVKVYDESIQVIRNKKNVSVFLNSGELFFEFNKEKEAKEFCDKALKLISGQSKLVRAVKKTQKAINETNEALDIDIAGIVKGTAVVAGEATIAATSALGGTKSKVIGAVVKSLFKKKENKAEIEENKQALLEEKTAEKV